MSELNLKLARRRRRAHGPRCVMCSVKLHKPAKPMPLAALAAQLQAPAEIEGDRPYNSTLSRAIVLQRQLP